MSYTTLVSRQAGVSPLQIRRVRKTVSSWVGFIPPVLARVVIIAPVLWTVSTSLRTPAQSFAVPPQWLPLHPDWSNYRAVFATVPYGSYLLNSAIVAVCTVAGQLITAALAGYAFARFSFPGKTVLFWLIMATMMIPL